VLYHHDGAGRQASVGVEAEYTGVSSSIAHSSEKMWQRAVAEPGRDTEPTCSRGSAIIWKRCGASGSWRIFIAGVERIVPAACPRPRQYVRRFVFFVMG